MSKTLKEIKQRSKLVKSSINSNIKLKSKAKNATGSKKEYYLSKINKLNQLLRRNIKNSTDTEFKAIQKAKNDIISKKKLVNTWLLQVDNPVYSFKWAGKGEYNFDYVQSGYVIELKSINVPSDMQILTAVKKQLSEALAYEEFIFDINTDYFYNIEMKGVPEAKNLENIENIHYFRNKPY